MSTTAIGLDIGGTAIKGVRVDTAGRVQRTETGVASPQRSLLLAEVRRVLDLLRADVNHPALGLATAGIPHRDGRSTQYCPGGKLDIEGLDWQTALAWSSPPPLLNDAHAALLGECWVGAARDRRHVVMLTLGTGVGGAVLADGRLLRGARGRAGHLGHLSVTTNPERGIVGTPGTLEDAIGEQTVTRRTAGRAATTAALVDEVRRGTPWAVEAWTASVRTLSRAVASIINAFDPEVVVLGGGIAQAGAALFDPLRDALAEDEWRLSDEHVPIVHATLGAMAGAIGAARAAIDPQLVVPVGRADPPPTHPPSYAS
jgi:glucokinase